MKLHCWECCYKHLCQALVISLESRKSGMSETGSMRFTGHLAEAEDECPSSEIAAMVRKVRLGESAMESLVDIIAAVRSEID